MAATNSRSNLPVSAILKCCAHLSHLCSALRQQTVLQALHYFFTRVFAACINCPDLYKDKYLCCQVHNLCKLSPFGQLVPFCRQVDVLAASNGRCNFR